MKLVMTMFILAAIFMAGDFLLSAEENEGGKKWFDGMVIELNPSKPQRNRDKPSAEKKADENAQQDDDASETEENPIVKSTPKRIGKREVKSVERDEEWYDGWESGNLPDAEFSESDSTINGLFSYAPYIQFEYAGADVIASSATQGVKFKLDLKVPATDIDEDEREDYIREAWVYYTTNNGVDWTKLRLHRETHRLNVETEIYFVKVKRKKSFFDKTIGRIFPVYEQKEKTREVKDIKELWTGQIDIQQLTEQEPRQFVYYFRATASNGSVTMELPVSNAVWPPDSAGSFTALEKTFKPGAHREPNQIGAVAVAFDGNYIYLSQRSSDAISPGTMSAINGYGFAFRDPDAGWMGFDIFRDDDESMIADKYYLYFPAHYYSFRTFAIGEFIMDQSPGRIADLCFNYRPFSDNSDTVTALGGNTLYTRIPITSICPKGCEKLSVKGFTTTAPTGDFALFPEYATPDINIYFRSHELGEGTGKVSVIKSPDEAVFDKPVYVVPGANEYLDSLSAKRQLTDKAALLKAQEEYKGWMQNFYDEPVREGFHFSSVYYGKGPFNIEPCDIVAYDGLYIETYERNNRIKARIFRDGKYEHTIMVGSDTSPRRDEQYRSGDHYITLSGFDYSPGCIIEIE